MGTAESVTNFIMCISFLPLPAMATAPLENRSHESEKSGY